MAIPSSYLMACRRREDKCMVDGYSSCFSKAANKRKEREKFLAIIQRPPFSLLCWASFSIRDHVIQEAKPRKDRFSFGIHQIVFHEIVMSDPSILIRKIIKLKNIIKTKKNKCNSHYSFKKSNDIKLKEIIYEFVYFKRI